VIDGLATLDTFDLLLNKVRKAIRRIKKSSVSHTQLKDFNKLNGIADYALVKVYFPISKTCLKGPNIKGLYCTLGVNLSNA
jgi:hypothetical protein